MQIQNILIEQIHPYDNNPRINDDAVKHVVKSIKEFGFRVPILIDCNNVIIAGHTRYEAAKQLDMKELPCIYADGLTDAQVRAFRITDNKTAEYAKWDMELLASEIEALKEIAFDISQTGFESWEIESMFNPVTIDDIKDFFVDKETQPKEPKTIKCPHCGEMIEL